MKNLLILVTSPLLLAATSVAAVGPDYQRPEVVSPLAWKQAAPAGVLPRGDWWKAFHDPALDDLVARALTANQNLAAAAARVEQARAAAGIARGSYLPSVGLNPSANRARTSETTDNRFPVAESTTYRASLDASWELDLFGRVRRLNESARAEAAASAADFGNVRLAHTG